MGLSIRITPFEYPRSKRQNKNKSTFSQQEDCHLLKSETIISNNKNKNKLIREITMNQTTRPTNTTSFKGCHPTHHGKGKMINKLALVLLSIVILELVLIGDQVQPVKAIKKKIFLKKLKKMLPLLALIKPKKKIILLPIPIPMQMMKQSYGGGYPISGPPLTMSTTNTGYNQYDNNSHMMLGSSNHEGYGSIPSSTTTNSGEIPSSSLPPATMQMVAPPTTMTMTITAGDGGLVTPASSVIMTPIVGPAPATSANLLSYQAASATIPNNNNQGDPSGELYYSSPYNKNRNVGGGGAAGAPLQNMVQVAAKLMTNNNNYQSSSAERLRSPVHYGQQMQVHNNQNYRKQNQRDQFHDIGQQQQQLSIHEIEMDGFSPPAPTQQQPIRQQTIQMIPFYPSDSESPSSSNSIQLPVLNNNYSGKQQYHHHYQQQQQRPYDFTQQRENEPIKASPAPQSGGKSGKVLGGGGY